MQALLNLDPIFWVLLVFSVATLSVSVLKAWQWLSLKHVFSKKVTGSVESLLTTGANGEAEESIRFKLLGQYAAEAKQNIRFTLLNQYAAAMKVKQLHGHALETEAWRLARLKVDQFGGYLKVLEVVATVAPLIGLLGTVLGMVEAFKAMELAGANVDPAVLSGGIWKALSTTAAGLIVAIPAFILHSWFDRKTEKAAGVIQNDLELFLAQSAQVK